MRTFAALKSISVFATPTLLAAFAPHQSCVAPSIGIRIRHRDRRLMIPVDHRLSSIRYYHRSSTINYSSSSDDDNDSDDSSFDPFLQSPLSFGKQSTFDDGYGDGGNNSYVGVGSSGEFGFHSTYADSTVVQINNLPLSINASSSSSSSTTTYCEIASDISLDQDTPAFEFDPLLSPHSYANGIAAGPIFSSHATTSQKSSITQLQQQKQRIGILLIDHGSKRPASNEHIHFVARMYQDRLDETATISTDTSKSTKSTTIVRVAHMEIASPSILESLRSIFAIDQVTKVVCVPYFLSPGRHATEDVPNLIDEARRILVGEGVIPVSIYETSMDSSILVSDALGTQLECMLRGVDILVENTLSE